MDDKEAMITINDLPLTFMVKYLVADPRSTWWHDGEEIVGAVRGFNDAALCKLVPEESLSTAKATKPCIKIAVLFKLVTLAFPSISPEKTVHS
ncbi:hypothetical protein HUJ05_012389 [Dendroctonus ponderosae]|nr:hypothetical protein HUJ05_012389 [Dendroctonus ponderosae]